MRDINTIHYPAYSTNGWAKYADITMVSSYSWTIYLILINV